MKRSSLILLLIVCPLTLALSQLRLVSAEQLPVSGSADWHQPRFAPDGKSVVFTTTSYDGVWQFSLTDRSTVQLTADPGSGSAFTLSPDGGQLVYRRTTYPSMMTERLQEIVVKNLAEKTTSVLTSAPSLSIPAFAGGAVVYAENVSQTAGTLKKAALTATLLGIEDTKIVLLRNGKKVALDPFGNGSYIWPQLSPSGDRIVAYEMGQGTFVCDLDGNVVAKLGRLDGAAWSRDGRWLIYMDDKDDGHRIVSSEIRYISSDGKVSGALTATPGVIEMFPSCSSAENKIVCSSLDGKLHLLTYEEVKP